MTVPLLAAVSGASWEADLVAALEGGADGVTVVRRCVDLADLLAAAAAGTGRAALVSADLRRLDQDALTRLALAHVAVVGLFTPGDDVAEARLRLLGLDHVLPADTPAHDIASAVASSLAGAQRRRADNHGGSALFSYGDPAAALADLSSASAVPNGSNGQAMSAASAESSGWIDPMVEPGSGRLVAVWGPTGAPGRTTVAVGIAGELARAGVQTLLADADTYGGSVAQVLGFLDEAPGLAAAARLANLGQLDLAALEPTPTKLVSNLPYNIATPLVVESLDGLPSVELWTVMVQREVADRFFAQPSTKAYGAVSVLVQLAAERTGFHPVSRTVFRPQPNVDSALVAFRRRTLPESYPRVKQVVGAAFAHRRKRLPNSLELAGTATREEAAAALEAIGRDSNARAEELAPPEFVALAEALDP